MRMQKVRWDAVSIGGRISCLVVGLWRRRGSKNPRPSPYDPELVALALERGISQQQLIEYDAWVTQKPGNVPATS